MRTDKVVINRFPFPQLAAIEKARTFTLEPVSFTVVRGDRSHATRDAQWIRFFFRRVFLSGLDSGLDVLNLVHCRLVSSFLIHVQSPGISVENRVLEIVGSKSG